MSVNKKDLINKFDEAIREADKEIENSSKQQNSVFAEIDTPKIQIVVDEEGYYKEVLINGRSYDISTPEAKQTFKNNIDKDLYKQVNEELVRAAKDRSRLKVVSIKPANQELKNKRKGKLSKVLSILLAAAVTFGITSCAAKKEKEDTDENTNPLTTEDYANMSVTELLSRLKEGYQKNAFTNMNEFQKYFNEIAANSIYRPYDNESKLYLTAEEINALYVYANADTLTKETFKEIFEHRNNFNDEELSINYTEASKVLARYYIRATEPSGVANLIEDDKTRNYFINFENLVLIANKEKTKENINALKNALKDILYSAATDNPTDEYTEAVGFIETFILPALEANQYLDEDLYNELVKHNETNTCNKIKGEITSIEEYISDNQTKEDDKGIIRELKPQMDEENIKVSNRDINLAGDFEQQEETNNNSYTYYNNGSYNNGTSNKTSSSTKTNISREQAVKEFGEQAVEKAEQQADNNAVVNDYVKPDGTKEDVSMNEANARELVKAEGMRQGYASTYNTAYNTTAQTGHAPSINEFNLTPNYSGNYRDSYYEGYRIGAESGIRNGYNDGIVEYNARQQVKDEEISRTEETFQEPTTNGNNSNNNQNVEQPVEQPKEDMPQEPQPEPEPDFSQKPEINIPDDTVTEEWFTESAQTVRTR